MSIESIIFLDIDGVLNSNRWLLSLNEGNWPENHIDPSAVGVLNEVVKKTDSKIVISSTWRKIHSFSKLCEMLGNRGLRADIIDVTPDFFKKPRGPRGKAYVRGDEIQAWLDDNGHDWPFVILDDDSDMAHLLPKLVHINNQDGLLLAHVPQILKHLEKP